MTNTTATKKEKASHTGIRNGNLFCFHCGTSYNVNLPQPINMVTAMMKQFAKDHKSCKKVWSEPVPSPDPTNSHIAIAKNAAWWAENGEHGMSSKFMYNTFWRQQHFPDVSRNHPLDPDDFKRCHLLLQAVPQWKTELHKLKSASKAWNNLVDNWDKLTMMYENKDDNMYSFMQELIGK